VIGGSDVEWGVGEEPVPGFGRERRLHARAYALWVSLLKGRRLPAFADLGPDHLTAFADHGVLIELAGRGHEPAIAYLGRALRDQAGLALAQPDPAEVPEGSLLAALLDRLPAILAAAAPVGFEAERADGSDAALLHRGILLPFAGDDDGLAAVLGVMSWKRVVALDADIVAAVESVAMMRPAPVMARPWGDGPGAADLDRSASPPLRLDQQLAAARTWSALADADRTQGTTALHAALNAAHQFLVTARNQAEGFATLARDAGLDERTLPETAITLIFTDATASTRRLYADALAHAERLRIGAGLLGATLDRWEGGLPAFAAAARARRKRGAHHPADTILIETIDADSPVLRGHRPAKNQSGMRLDAA
jgi:hypothetical protein